MKEWETFYLITGAAASTLIGIQFVVITLVATVRSRHTSPESIGAFGTPTVVHFSAALLIAAVMAAPWSALTALGMTVAALAVVEFAYSAAIVYRARRQTAYEPSHGDLWWYLIAPCAAYLAELAGGILLCSSATAGPLLIGASTLSLLLIGIHNAWDTVTYMVIRQAEAGTVLADESQP